MVTRMASVIENKGLFTAKMYPVPAGDDVNILFSGDYEGPVNLRVFNVFGQLVAEEIIPWVENERIITQDLSRLAPGAFFVEIHTTGNSNEVIRMKGIRR
jgi:hypothetical protein